MSTSASPSLSSSFSSFDTLSSSFNRLSLDNEDSDDVIVWPGGVSEALSSSFSDISDIQAASDDDFVVLSRPRSPSHHDVQIPLTPTVPLRQTETIPLPLPATPKAGKKSKKSKKKLTDEEKAQKVARRAEKKARKAARKAAMTEEEKAQQAVLKAERRARRAARKLSRLAAKEAKALAQSTGKPSTVPKKPSPPPKVLTPEKKAIKAAKKAANQALKEVKKDEKACKKKARKAAKAAETAKVAVHPLNQVSSTATLKPSAPNVAGGLGTRSIVDDASERLSEFGDDAPPTIYEEAAGYITSFLANPEAKNDKVCNLTLLQSLIIELGLQTPSLPISLKSAKTLIKTKAFLNIREYLSVRSRGQEAIRNILHPSRKALIKDIRKKRNPATLSWVKEHGLQVLLVSCYSH